MWRQAGRGCQQNVLVRNYGSCDVRSQRDNLLFHVDNWRFHAYLGLSKTGQSCDEKLLKLFLFLNAAFMCTDYASADDNWKEGAGLFLGNNFSQLIFLLACICAFLFCLEFWTLAVNFAETLGDEESGSMHLLFSFPFFGFHSHCSACTFHTNLCIIWTVRQMKSFFPFSSVSYSCSPRHRRKLVKNFSTQLIMYAQDVSIDQGAMCGIGVPFT